MDKLKLQIPNGAWDYLPDECAAKKNIEDQINAEFFKNGYDRIETPSFEYYEVFMHDAVPYVQENMIKFFDLQGRILALRPDITGPIARMAATKLLAKQDVLRLCYTGNAYGFLNSGISGKTEFTQAGVELIGKSGADADAEVIALAIQSLLCVGVADFKIDIGQVAFFKGLMSELDITDTQADKIRQLIDTKNNVELEYELSRTTIDAQTKSTLLELGNLFGGVEVLGIAQNLAKNEECKNAVKNIGEVYKILCDFGYKDYISIDFGILNNFNYYSGIIFRGISDRIGTPILSGGRYDDLLQEFGASAAATGFAMGIKELLIVLEKQGALKINNEKITVIKCTQNERERAYQVAQKLRNSGKRVVIEMNGNDYDCMRYDVCFLEDEVK
ncbi:MAG: ATP phosphoribosyltransferase regulatory subunit [Christensenellaceae bacterium]